MRTAIALALALSSACVAPARTLGVTPVEHDHGATPDDVMIAREAMRKARSLAVAGEPRPALRDRLHRIARVAWGTPLGSEARGLARQLDAMIAEDEAYWYAPERPIGVERWLHELRERRDLLPSTGLPWYVADEHAGRPFPFTGADAPRLLALWDDARPTRTIVGERWIRYGDIARDALRRLAGERLASRADAAAFVARVESGEVYDELYIALRTDARWELSRPPEQGLVLLEPERAIDDLFALIESGQLDGTAVICHVMDQEGLGGVGTESLLWQLAQHASDRELRILAIAWGGFTFPASAARWSGVALEELARPTMPDAQNASMLFEPIVLGGPDGLPIAERIWSSLPDSTRKAVLDSFVHHLTFEEARAWTATPFFEEIVRAGFSDETPAPHDAGTIGDRLAHDLVQWLGLAIEPGEETAIVRAGWRLAALNHLRAARGAASLALTDVMSRPLMDARRGLESALDRGGDAALARALQRLAALGADGREAILAVRHDRELDPREAWAVDRALVAMSRRLGQVASTFELPRDLIEGTIEVDDVVRMIALPMREHPRGMLVVWIHRSTATEMMLELFDEPFTHATRCDGFGWAGERIGTRVWLRDDDAAIDPTGWRVGATPADWRVLIEHALSAPSPAPIELELTISWTEPCAI